MPLHLLGKKSWNVYNADNIERVRRDEAAAAAREAEQERRMQEDDAARRLAILRGEEPPPPPPPQQRPELGPGADGDDGAGGRPRHGEWGSFFEGRKRKRRGEDDTDFEMRVARERAAMGGRAARGELGRDGGARAAGVDGREGEVSLVDARGHIDLFGAAKAEEEEEDARRGRDGTQRDGRPRREDPKPAATSAAEEGHGMRFADAGGRQAGLADGRKPWYAAREAEPEGAAAREMQVRPENVFGREDPGRKAREVARLSAGDPLAAMKSGAKKVRELERDRRKEREEHERELRDLKREERRREKRRRHEGKRRHDDADDLDSLDGFILDGPPPPSKQSQSDRKHRDERHRDRHRHGDRHHRDRDRSSRDDEKDDRRPQSDRERSDGHRSHRHRRHHEHSR